MPIETFGFLDSLNASYPPTSDGLVGGDDHIRGIKSTLKSTFPNITGAVTATQAQLNAAAALTDSGANKLADAGAFFKTNSTDGFTNPLAGNIDVILGGATAGEFLRTGGVNFFKWHGPATFDAEIKGPGITPVGAAVMWFDDTLPSDGLWAWANGQVIANANVVAPILLARWGSRFGGNGVTTMGVPNMQEVVPVGKSGMGGASAPGLLTSIASGIKDILHAAFGIDTVTLTPAQMPAHQHSVYLKDPGHNHTWNGAVGGSGVGSPGASAIFGGTTTVTTSPTGITIGSVPGTANDNLTTGVGGGTAHTNLQPSRVVNWIIRIG